MFGICWERRATMCISKFLTLTCLAAELAACAGRSPQPVAVVQPLDSYLDCSAIAAEVQANNAQLKELASEEGAKVAQNVAAGVAGLVIWPLWFAMDFQGAASTETTALQSRQQYLATLAEQKRCGASPASASREASAPATRESIATLAITPVPMGASAAAGTPTSPAPSAASASVTGPESSARVVLVPMAINNPYYPPSTYVDVR